MSSPVQDLSVLHQRREQRLMLALALPALLVILLLVVLPVGWLAWRSVPITTVLRSRTTAGSGARTSTGAALP